MVLFGPLSPRGLDLREKWRERCLSEMAGALGGHDFDL